MSLSRKAMVVTAAALLMSSVAACSSSGSSSKSSTAETNPTYKVMTLGPFPGPNFSFPGIKSGLEAAVAYFDKHGGFGPSHAHLAVIACNTQADPNLEASCARKAVSDNVVAVIAGLTLTPNSVTGTLEAAGIPWVAYTAATPDQLASSIGFPIQTITSLYIGAGQAAAKGGCKISAVVSAGDAASQSFVPPIQAGIKSGGGQSKTITVPNTGADFAPIIAQAIASGAECVVANLNPGLATPFLTAVSSAEKKLTVYAPAGVFPPAQAAADPKLYDGLTVTSMLPALNDSADIKNWESVVGSYDPAGFRTESFDYLQPWIGVTMLHSVTRAMPEITARNVLNAMRSAKLNLGFEYSMIDFSSSVNGDALRGVYYTKVFVQKASNGKFTTTETIDTRSTLEASGK